jgi:ATP-dependent helicase IRC3
MGSPLGLVNPEESHHGQTLIVVSSVELASQAEAAAQRLLGEGWSIEVEQGKRQASGYADV